MVSSRRDKARQYRSMRALAVDGGSHRVKDILALSYIVQGEVRGPKSGLAKILDVGLREVNDSVTPAIAAGLHVHRQDGERHLRLGDVQFQGGPEAGYFVQFAHRDGGATVEKRRPDGE